jgi:hypothetical protein
MKSYKEWQAQQLQQAAAMPTKGWKMGKDQIFQHWSQLQGNMPLSDVRAIPPDHKGSTYHYDGIRITGSARFIDSCISRLKDLLQFEGKGTRLQVVYRQQQDNKTQLPIPESFVFYVQIHGRPEKNEIEKPKKPKFSAKLQPKG